MYWAIFAVVTTEGTNEQPGDPSASPLLTRQGPHQQVGWGTRLALDQGEGRLLQYLRKNALCPREESERLDGEQGVRLRCLNLEQIAPPMYFNCAC